MFLTKYINRKYYPKNIIIHAQYNSKNVYLKSGYIIEGKPFIEAKIKHVKMIYNEQKK
jgi:predicted GNAT family N-acyltransferase